MAKKKKLESKAPVPMTRGQLSRAQREQRQIRNLYTAGIALVTLVVLLLGLSALSTFVLRPNQEVASVNGKTINRATYDKLRRYSIYQEMQNQVIQQSLGSQTGTLDTLTTLQQQLRSVEDETTLDPTVIGTLVDAEVLRQASAKDFQINLTAQELRAAAVEDFIPSPTPPSTPAPTVDASTTVTATSAVTPTATPSPTRGSPTVTPTVTPTLPPVAGAQETAESVYSRYAQAIDQSTAPHPNDPFCEVGCPDMAEEDYLMLIIDPRERREQVIEKLAATSVLTEVEQVNVQHILTDTQEGASAIRARLDAGEDFTLLANTQSSEQIRNAQNGIEPNGGNLGWFAQQGSNLVQEFADAAFQVQAGQYSQPVQTQFGWHIIKVLERDPKRALDTTQIEARKTEAYDDWFQKAKDAANIVPRPTPTPVIPTQPAIVEPTPILPTTAPGSPPATDATSPAGTATLPSASPTGTVGTGQDGAAPADTTAAPVSTPPASP